MNKKRKAIYDKTGGRCYYCGSVLVDRWQVDHLEPVRRRLDGPGMMHPERDVESNKVPSCASCNRFKGSMSIESFRALIGGLVTSLNRDSTQYKISKRYGLVQETGCEVLFWFERHKIDYEDGDADA